MGLVLERHLFDMYSGGIGIYYLNITPQSEARTPTAKPYMPYTYIPCFYIIKVPFHGHIFAFMGTSSPSFCSHHSSPANLKTYQQSESKAKAKAKAKPNMMIICSGPRHAQKTFESSFHPARLKAWTTSVP